MFAENSGLPDEAADIAEDALRVEQIGPDTFQMHVGASEPPVRIAKWKGVKAREEAAELIESLPTSHPGYDRIRSVLERAVEIVGFELKVSHTRGMGWPIAHFSALRLGEAADGLVDEDDVWYDPATWDELT